MEEELRRRSKGVVIKRPTEGWRKKTHRRIDEENGYPIVSSLPVIFLQDFEDMEEGPQFALGPVPLLISYKTMKVP